MKKQKIRRNKDEEEGIIQVTYVSNCILKIIIFKVVWEKISLIRNSIMPDVNWLSKRLEVDCSRTNVR